MFINRLKEKEFLEGKYSEDKAQLIVLWGKRRVGKTELVKSFIHDKPHVYFLAESTTEKEQLNRFSILIGEFFKEPLLLTRGFATWEESFKYIKEKNERFVLAIDEYPYLMQSNPGISSLFQRAWDEYWHDSRLYLILLGSSVAMMETEVLGYKAPLYGRRTGQWKVQPMTFSEISNFRASKPFEDKLMHYALGGGIPAYWLQLSEKKGFYQNIKDHVIKKGDMLYDEVEFLLREELREPRYYFAILHSIAQGKRKLSEIVNATGIQQSVANKYLSVLADLDIVEREIPVTEDKPLKSKKGLYRIKDEYFQFWFRFVFPRRGYIEMEQIDYVLDKIKEDMPQYLSLVYERIAVDMVRQQKDQFLQIERLGRWWDKNEEIDIVGIDTESNTILFGEVKWTAKPVGVNIFHDLQTKSTKVSWGNKDTLRRFVIFSKNGFTADMIDLAKKEKVILFRADERIS